MFRHQAEAFGASLAPNLPGHDAPGGAEDVAQFADFIQAQMQGEDLREVVVCGNSLGGAIALELALRRLPSIIAVIAIGSGSRLRVAKRFLDGLECDFECTMRELAELMFANPTPSQIAEVCESMQRVGHKQTQRDFLACDRFNVDERLAEIGVPLLAITGAGDVMTPPKYGAALAARVQRGQARIISGGHLAMLENPGATNEAIANFVQAIGSL
ncbi:MAG: alpha/beta fold hydrolase [Vulcanimicrobiaceae bacterium]